MRIFLLIPLLLCGCATHRPGPEMAGVTAGIVSAKLAHERAATDSKTIKRLSREMTENLSRADAKAIRVLRLLGEQP